MHTYHKNSWPPYPGGLGEEEEAELLESMEEVKSEYRLEPMSWEELNTIVKNKDFSNFCRSELQQTEYNRFKLVLKQKWKSIDDYILVNYFDFEEREEEDGDKLKYANPSLSEAVKDKKNHKTKLTLNKFPYFVPENVEHWVMFRLGGSVTEEDAQRSMEEIRSKHPDEELEFLHWVNPVEYKSIPDIDHFQIMCLHTKKPKEDPAKKACCVIM